MSKNILLADMISNTRSLYEGDMIYYFRCLFFNAENVNHPYHNFRHMLYVFAMCYLGALYYKDKLSKVEIRNMLIAALFHDFNHTGEKVPDNTNIARAIAALKVYILDQDKPHLLEIETIIRSTEFPHSGDDEPSLVEQIIRDADVSQVLTEVWQQQVIFGLAKEWGSKPLDVLNNQENFLSKISFYTTWARELFSESIVRKKIDEANGILKILTN